MKAARSFKNSTLLPIQRWRSVLDGLSWPSPGISQAQFAAFNPTLRRSYNAVYEDKRKALSYLCGWRGPSTEVIEVVLPEKLIVMTLSRPQRLSCVGSYTLHPQTENGSCINVSNTPWWRLWILSVLFDSIRFVLDSPGVSTFLVLRAVCW